jgi:superfamily II DNA or RNA helicase
MEFSNLLQQLDPRPDIRGRQFELLCRWYLRSAPEYKRRFTDVWLWAEWPDAWSADAGIDLVAEEHDGSLWAVQAKAYGDAYAIKKGDVDSFLSESSRPQFSYRLLVATTDRIGATARRTLEGQSVPVGYLLRSQLELAQVQWPSTLDTLRPRRPQRKKPLPHIREAIRATVKGFDRSERGQLIMACGTGKTLVGLWSSERLQSVRTLVLVPSLSLLAQTLREWTANAAEPFDYLAVCSDETVVGEDEFVASTAELGVPVTTDPTVISTFLRRRGRRVVFSTYQSSPQIAAAQRKRSPRFDLAIADEAHRCAGRVTSEFATILDADQIKSKRRLFMTATPRYYTPRVRREAGQLDVEIASMDDERSFGPVVHRLTFGEAIQRDLLSDYQVVVVGADDDTYASWAKRGEFVTRDGKKITDARTLAGQIGLAKTMRRYRLRRTISFHGRIRAAKEFSDDFPGLVTWMPSSQRPGGRLWSRHVSSQMTSGQRDRLLLRFRTLGTGERNLLSNARCLGEGVDVPSIDGVAFIDPRHSTIDIIQAVGRAIRKAPDKRIGTVVVPVFVPTNMTAEEALDESSFSHVWDVLKALRAHDDLLADELDELRQRSGALRREVSRPSKIKLDLPQSVGLAFARAFDALLVEKTTTSWEFWFGLLTRFMERKGHARVPSAYVEDGYRLGSWVSNQRGLYAQGRLDPEYTARLAAVSGWAWDAQEAKWHDGFANLLAFVEREGHARVPQGRTENGFKLGTWVSGQRQSFSVGKLDPERQSLLSALPGWLWDPRSAAWDEGVNHLLKFVEREGHARVPHGHLEHEYRLGSWVIKQRQFYRAGKLDARREALLVALPGWVWSVQEAAWEEGFAHLLTFLRREGHARVPWGHVEDGFKLFKWVRGQRQSHARRAVDPKRAARLSALPGWTWDPREVAWDEGFAHLRSFVEREGHARVPSSHVEDAFPLGTWVGNQRAAFLGRRERLGRKRLDPERQKQLEALPGWAWNQIEANWEEGFAHLRSFVEREGHARVPQDDLENGYRLGQWVAGQRGAYRGHKLGQNRVKQLEALPGWGWNIFDAAWEEGFARLQSFVQREGHVVPQGHVEEDGFRLGSWAMIQRGAYRSNKLDHARVRRLEALAGWVWEPHQAKWEAGYAHLLRFVEREGDAAVPDAYREDGFQLGKWVGKQRAAFRRNKLLPQRAKRLAALPGWLWDAGPSNSRVAPRRYRTTTVRT